MAFVRDSIKTILTKVILFVCLIFISLYIARVLGPVAKGKYSLLVSFVLITVTIGIFGINSSVLYFLGRRKYNIKSLYSNGLFLLIIQSLILLVIFFIFGKFFQSSFLKGIKQSNILIMLFSIPALLVTYLSIGIILGKNKISAYNLLAIVSSAISLLNFVILVVIFKQELRGALLAYVLSAILSTCIYVFVISRLSRFTITFNRPIIMDLLSYGLRTFLGHLFLILNLRVTLFFVNYFTELALVGYYSIAISLAEIILFAPDAVGTILFPKLASTEPSFANKLTCRASRTILLFSMIIGIFFFVFGKSLVVLVYGETYIPAVRPFSILLPGTVLMSLRHVFFRNFAARGNPGINSSILFLSLVLNVILNILLIPKWAIEGAALATTVSYATCTFISILFFKKLSKESVSDILLLKHEDISYIIKELRIIR